MDRLLDGYRRFRAEVWPAERARYQALARSGQSPETLVIACSDSRVDPQTVFGAGPGELFVLRNVAGLVPPYHPDSGYHGTSAALEFGVRVLKVARIVVLGHAQCGGVRAMVEGAPEEARDFVEPWMAIAAPVLQQMPDHIQPDDILGHCETEVVRLSLANLATFPWIEEAVAEQRLKLQGFRFDIHTGVLAKLEGDRFVSVA
ncbi:MAG: carbonic anhydrase [Rhizobiales bacterium]|nr:carbonic anhydrase [Hyphomicrobiales bacterium]MDQ3557852.1 carbonic anhydrase [Pseudomonadota bacterium]